MSTGLAIDTSTTKVMLCTRVTNTILLPYGELNTKMEANRPRVRSFKGVGLKIVALPQEMLYLLQDGVTVKLRAW